MKVRIKYFMTFSQLAGKRSDELEVGEGIVLSDLIDIIKKKNGREFGKYLGESIKNNTVAFLVNKSNAGENEALNDGDEVIISHIVGGG